MVGVVPPSQIDTSIICMNEEQMHIVYNMIQMPLKHAMSLYALVGLASVYALDMMDKTPVSRLTHSLIQIKQPMLMLILAQACVRVSLSHPDPPGGFGCGVQQHCHFPSGLLGVLLAVSVVQFVPGRRFFLSGFSKFVACGCTLDFQIPEHLNIIVFQVLQNTNGYYIVIAISASPQSLRVESRAVYTMLLSLARRA